MNFWKGQEGQRGQTATEYMLILAVVVLGILAAASAFIPQFKNGVNTLSSTVNQWFQTNPALCDPNDSGCN